jgi:cobalt-zinc-cadmium efflux system membrane fusion protein
MNIKFNIPVLLIVSFLLIVSCQEEKPVKVKKQFSFQKETGQQKQIEKEELEERDTTIVSITKSQFNELGMKLGTAGVSAVSEAITAAGYIEVPKEGIAKVGSYLGGYLHSTPLLPGDYVKKGQFLISLENLEYVQLQQDYLQAADQVNYLRTVYERKKTLAEEQITSQSSKQQAESEYMSAMANYEGLRKMLQLININPDKLQPGNIVSSINLYSPIDGYITEVNAVKGKFADPADVIFEIMNTDHLHLELKVYEKDILKVRKGQKITFRVPEANEQSFTGKVFLVGKTIDETDRTVTVHCHIDEGILMPVIVGMYIEAEIFHATKERFCLPTAAFVREDGEYFVFLVKTVSDQAYVFEKTKVEIGIVNEDCVEIVGKSQQMLDDKQVLIEGAYDL